MISRCFLFIFASLLLMAARCNHLDCSKLAQCDFHMKQILTSPGGDYTAVSGQRFCNGKMVLQEVSVSHKGAALDNKCGNVYISSDTSSLLSIAWQNGDQLQITHKSFNSTTTLQMKKKIGKDVGLIYQDH